MKAQTEIEQLLLQHPDGLTHKEIARRLSLPEPSVRRALQVVRAHAPRFKAGMGTWDVIATDVSREGSKVWAVKWRTKSFKATKCVFTVTDEEGVKHELTNHAANARISFPEVTGVVR